MKVRVTYIPNPDGDAVFVEEVDCDDFRTDEKNNLLLTRDLPNPGGGTYEQVVASYRHWAKQTLVDPTDDPEPDRCPVRNEVGARCLRHGVDHLGDHDFNGMQAHVAWEPSVRNPPKPTEPDVLSLPMESEPGIDTVRDYLVALLERLWLDGEGFSGKRPFGNSGWRWDLIKPLDRAGLVNGLFDEDGYVRPNYDRDEADRARGIISEAIRKLAQP